MPADSLPVRGSDEGGRGSAIDDLYLLILGLVLFGYATAGKGFAYMGVPPLYIGEIVLAGGLIVLLRSGCLIASLVSVPSLLLLVLMSWIAFRTGQGFQIDGIDALRDSVVVIYGCFAFIAAALIIAKPDRVARILRYFRWFSTAFVFAAPIMVILSNPAWPNTSWPLISVRSGEVSVHLAGIGAFAVLGFRKHSWVWSICFLFAVAAVIVQSRGGMLAIASAVLVASLFARSARQLTSWAIVASLLIGAALLVDLNIPSRGERSFHVDQLVANMTGIFGESNVGNLEGTKEWRLRWWRSIVQYTLEGEHFWTGKGFGPNLAIVDGFVVGLENGGPPVRSPHNVHLTILARSGVPGAALWAIFLLSWFAMMTRNALNARRSGQPVWGQFFAFILCYVLAVLVDATFDVAIEGPMVGIWFWTLIGIGLGSSMVFRALHPRSPLWHARTVLPARSG